MIHIFNKRRLIIEVSLVQTNRIKETLEDKGIECTYKIIPNDNKNKYKDLVSKDVKFLFDIYVKDKDYDKSVDILEL